MYKCETEPERRSDATGRYRASPLASPKYDECSSVPRTVVFHLVSEGTPWLTVRPPTLARSNPVVTHDGYASNCSHDQWSRYRVISELKMETGIR